MAKNTDPQAAETILPDNGGERADIGPGPGYLALVEWIRQLEEDDADVRVYAIVTTDPNAPREEFLKYSRPPVKQGAMDGYEKADGSIMPSPI